MKFRKLQAPRRSRQWQHRNIQVDGWEVHVIEKPIRNTHLRVRAEADSVITLQVTCPFHTPDSYIASFVRQNEAWIARAIKREQARAQERRQNPSADLRGLVETAAPQQLKEWRAVLEACVPALIEQWEPILGVKAGKLAYRKMVSRWGSCQPATGRICINIALAAYPPQCLEYVVVHELCHLLVRNHSAKFYGLLDRVMPDWRARKKLLN